MNLLTGMFFLSFGLLQMMFGIYIIYYLLPFWYGIFGMYIGFALGQAIFGIEGALTAWLTWTLALLIGGFLAYSSYTLKPYHPYVLRGVIGLAIGFLIVATFGITGGNAFLFALFSAVMYTFFVNDNYDSLIITGSSITGAAFLIDGLFLLSGLEIYNRFNQEIYAIALWLACTVFGIVWQSLIMKKSLHPGNKLLTNNSPYHAGKSDK